MIETRTGPARHAAGAAGPDTAGRSKSRLAMRLWTLTVIDPRAALWVLPWLAGLLILSWLGRYNGSPPTVFGVTLLATNHLPNWWDLAAIAAFSLVIYYWAVHSTLPHQRVSAAVEQVETEASVELEKSLV